MASLPSSMMNSPKQKNSSSIDAVLGVDDLITEILKWLSIPRPSLLFDFKQPPIQEYVSLDGKSLLNYDYFLNNLPARYLRKSICFSVLQWPAFTKHWKLSVNQDKFRSSFVNFANVVSWNDSVYGISPMGNDFSFLPDKDCLQTITRPPLPEN
ncbi:hypothetical protein SADUNF_Sadunf01G0008000 [Salix dunnii]|uniref:Uncharacterized protein n=1 Tax=Salix dunnii TaxID=1413687 RepID=A0A835N998_9ROSI|nr:hypothetical protein SADUNF_Sadunf01G0008000 [Salix dunnii]